MVVLFVGPKPPPPPTPPPRPPPHAPIFLNDNPTADIKTSYTTGRESFYLSGINGTVYPLLFYLRFLLPVRPYLYNAFPVFQVVSCYKEPSFLYWEVNDYVSSYTTTLFTVVVTLKPRTREDSRY